MKVLRMFIISENLLIRFKVLPATFRGRLKKFSRIMVHGDKDLKPTFKNSFKDFIEVS